MRLAIAFLILAMTGYAATRLQSPKGRELFPEPPKRLRVVPRVSVPPLPPGAVPRIAAPAAPPVVRTQTLSFFWQGPDEYHKRVAWHSNTTVILWSNYTVIQRRSVSSTNWQTVVETAATNYVWKGTNSDSLFRLTSVWK